MAASSAAIKQLGGRSPRLELMQSFAEHGQRCAVVVRKDRVTPSQFPRKDGIPKQQPL